MQVCTVVARNWLPQATVLLESFRDHHDDVEATLLVTEPDDGVHLTGATVVTPAAIGIPEHELRHQAAIYDRAELANALKPWLVAAVLERSGEPALFLDPDTLVLGSLTSTTNLAARRDVVLTPHRATPVPDDGQTPTELDLLVAGRFNLGFLAAGVGATAMLDWWRARLARWGVASPERGVFADQRWMDVAVSYFPHAVLEDPGVNVGYWNVDERPITRRGGRLVVDDDRPLRLFHFSGFDPSAPDRLTRHAGARPRVELRDAPVLHEMCERYAARLHDAGAGSVADDYSWGVTARGLPIDRRMRSLFRDALLRFELGEGPVPPDPFDVVGAEQFEAWLKTPSRDDVWPEIGRYVEAVWCERPDVQAEFASLRGRDGERFLGWLRAFGHDELDVPTRLLHPA